jgi:hypothetical protein
MARRKARTVAFMKVNPLASPQEPHGARHLYPQVTPFSAHRRRLIAQLNCAGGSVKSPYSNTVTPARCKSATQPRQCCGANICQYYLRRTAP